MANELHILLNALVFDTTRAESRLKCVVFQEKSSKQLCPDTHVKSTVDQGSHLQ